MTPWKSWKTAAQLYSPCDSSGQRRLLVVTGLLVQLGLRLSWSRSKSGMGWCKEQGTGWGDRHTSGVARVQGPGQGEDGEPSASLGAH